MITQTDIVNVLQKLSISRPAFCSEADFQLALAWELKKYLEQKQCCTYEVFIERRFEIDCKGCYVDICLESKDEIYLIELKYKTICETVVVSSILGEKYTLREQAANDLGRYGYLKDIHRIENILENSPKNIRKGFAIILTNDPKYYQEPTTPLKTIDRTFRIHERGISLNPFVNSIEWTIQNATPKWIKNYPPFVIQRIPSFNWHTYNIQGDSTFRYMISEI